MQISNANCLLSLHEKPGISNLCYYRVLYSFIVVVSIRSGESHNYTKTPVIFYLFQWYCSCI